MKILIYSIFFLCATLKLQAQTTFTEQLQQQRAGQGKVTLHQSESLTRKVNGQDYQKPQNLPEVPKKELTGTTADDDEALQTTTPEVRKFARPRGTTTGYRIQIFAGSNSRTAHADANKAANLCRQHFPNERIYTHFESPRWVCRVGNFTSREEADALLSQMLAGNLFREAIIVKCKIQVF